MARVVPVGPIDPELYAFAKKEAEKAERNPRYVPKKRETPAHTVFYRRAGATVKAFVIDKIAPVLVPIGSGNALPVIPQLPSDVIPDDEYEEKTTKVANARFQKYRSHDYRATSLTGAVHRSFISGQHVYSKTRNVVDGGYTYRYVSPPDGTTYATLHVHDANAPELGYVSLEDPADYGEPLPIIKYKLEISRTGSHQVPNGVYELNDFPEYHVGKYTGGERYKDKYGVDQVVAEVYYSNSMGLAATPVSIYEKITDSEYEKVIKSNFVKYASLEIERHLLVATIDKNSFSAKSADDIRPPVVLSGDSLGFRANIIQEYHYDPRELGYMGQLDYEVMAELGAGCDVMWQVQTLALPSNTNRANAPINRYLNKTIDGGYAYDYNLPLVPEDERTKSYARVSAPGNRHISLVGMAIDSLGDVYHLVFVFESEIPESTWEYANYIGETPEERHARIWHRFGGGARYELYRNGAFARVVKEVSSSDMLGEHETTAIDWHALDDSSQIANWMRSFYVKNHNVVEHIYGYADKSGGCAVVFSKARAETHLSAQQGFGATALTDDGLFSLNFDMSFQEIKKDMYAMFIPIERPEDGISVLEVDSDSTIYKLRPHKKFEQKPIKADPDNTRIQYANLFVRYKSEDGKPRRCYAAFDDGVCVDLSEFADALKANPGVTAEDWKDQPFRYSPVENYESAWRARRIKRDYAPQWVRAYYDYEDAQ